MNEPAKIRIEAEIDAETYAVMRDLLERLGCEESEFVADAIKRATEYDVFIQEGIDAADRGDVILQEEMERWFEERVAGRHAG